MGLLSWFKKEKTAKDDLIDFESMYEGVDELGVRGYKLSHLNCDPIPYKGNDSIYR